MNKIFVYQHFLKGHLVTIIGILLCFYFSYHAVFGHRSITALNALTAHIQQAVVEKDIAVQERMALEHKVTAMRPDSINPDLLEERARAMLGYKRIDEITILSN